MPEASEASQMLSGSQWTKIKVILLLRAMNFCALISKNQTEYALKHIG